jgi:hypothetical protein
MTHTDSENKTKDDVYRERNLLALAFIRFCQEFWHQTDQSGQPAGGWWPDTDEVNGEEWAVVWTETEYGQVGWHVPLWTLPEWLDKRDPDYDGYSTAEKNARMKELIYE